jgi:DNA mismatch endonuclease (patch repair protein)
MAIAVPAWPQSSSPGVRSCMQSNRRADTRPEVLLRCALHREGWRFRKDLRLDLADGRVRPDIAFTKRKIAVFVDGCFWHACPAHFVPPKSNTDYWTAKIARNVERDRATNAVLAGAGWLVIRIWEHEDVSVASARIGLALS